MPANDDIRLDLFVNDNCSEENEVTRRLVPNTQGGACVDINSPSRKKKKNRRRSAWSPNIREKLCYFSHHFIELKRFRHFKFRKPRFSPNTKYSRCPDETADVMSADDDTAGESKVRWSKMHVLS